MYYDGRKVKQHTRYLMGMGGEMLSNHYTIKDCARVRKVCRLDCQGSDTSGVRGIGCSDMRLHDVLHTSCELLVAACERQ